MTNLARKLISKIKSKASPLPNTSHLSDNLVTNLPDVDWFETEIDGIKWRLYIQHQIDKEIALRVFELKTTDLIKKIIKPGMKILDIGANIGYYTLIMGKLIGDNGELWAFEPVKRYREQNIWHIQANHLENHVHMLDFALSDTKTTADIIVDNISATMHWVGSSGSGEKHVESIKLDALDNVSKLYTLPKIDFIKIDTDGHEPFIFKGAKDFFSKQKPLMVVEFAQLVLDEANSDVRELKEIIESLGYTLYSEKTLKPFESRRDFLVECGNFAYSANVWAVPDQKIQSLTELF
jgi:FkbM family methyltransferase